MPDALLHAAAPMGVRLGCEDGVATQELLKLPAVGVTGTPHSDVLLQTQVLHLVTHSGGGGGGGGVGLCFNTYIAYSCITQNHIQSQNGICHMSQLIIMGVKHVTRK